MSEHLPPLRLAMIGMIEGNGHPYSWSAIVNGFDPTAMERCPYPVIPRYLGAQPPGSVRIAGANVTHIWTDRAEDAPAVAAAALIPHVAARPEDVIAHVDAVMIATDDGFAHVDRARPFIEAGLPVFIDKPLALTTEDLGTFIAWRKRGARILSSSGLRFAPELDPLLEDASALGELRWISGVTCKTWERYGIHVLEPIFRLIGPGFVSVRLEGRAGLEVAQLQHRSGLQVTVPVIADGGATFGTVHLCGTGGQTTIQFRDTYNAFRRQVVGFIDFARHGVAPYPFDHTVELMSVLIAGLRSREEGARRVLLEEIRPPSSP